MLLQAGNPECIALKNSFGPDVEKIDDILKYLKSYEQFCLESLNFGRHTHHNEIVILDKHRKLITACYRERPGP